MLLYIIRYTRPLPGVSHRRALCLSAFGGETSVPASHLDRRLYCTEVRSRPTFVVGRAIYSRVLNFILQAGTKSQQDRNTSMAKSMTKCAVLCAECQSTRVHLVHGPRPRTTSKSIRRRCQRITTFLHPYRNSSNNPIVLFPHPPPVSLFV